MTYTLRKLELEEGSKSAVPNGYSSTLPFMRLVNHETEQKKMIDTLGELEVGWQVFLFNINGEYHRTSKIREILEQDNKRVVFKTQTSVYELIDHAEGEDE